MTLPSSSDPTGPDVAEGDSSRFGRYALLEALGSDQHTPIYRAIHLRLRKQVALRLLPRRKGVDDHSRDQYAEKFRTVCKLSHPNLARVETAGEHDGMPYVVMEFVPGLDLEKVIEKQGPLSLADACQLVGQAAMGLEHLHQHGLAHQGVRAANLILTPSGLLKIVGLGEILATQNKKDFRGDLRDLAHTLCWAIGCAVDDIQSRLPSELMRLLERAISTDLQVAAVTPQEFLKVLAPRSTNCDLPSLLSELELSLEAGSRDDWTHGTSEYLRAETRLPIEPSDTTITSSWILVAALSAMTLCVTIFALFVAAVPHAVPTFSGGDDSAESKVTFAEGTGPAITAITKPIVADWETNVDKELEHEEFEHVELERDAHEPPHLADHLLASIKPDRDAFDMQIRSTDGGTEFQNLTDRGLAQFPVIMPERYTLLFSVERMEGDGSFGIGFSAGKARMIALIDHQRDGVWQSGMYFADSTAETRIAEPLEQQVLEQHVPVQIAMEVSPDRVRLSRIDEATSRRISSWTASENSATPANPRLTRDVDAYYPYVSFVHLFQGAFRVSEMRLRDCSADPVPRPFHGPDATSESRLADRIVWRGGHVEIITDSGTRTVHYLRDLTSDPWLVGVEKCPMPSRLMIGDAELKRLSAIKGIRKLDLTHTQVTTAGLSVLVGMRSLNSLALPRVGIDGDAVDSLHDLPALRELKLVGVSLEDDDVEALSRFPRLKSLCLTGCPISDDAVVRLAPCLPELEHLCLSGTKVSGSFLPALESLPNLKDLQLHQTQVDDIAMGLLPELANLRKITLRESNVSAATIARLRQDRPSLDIQ